MNEEEFLDYLYNNSDNLNLLVILEYLFDKYSYATESQSTYLPLCQICNDFKIAVYNGNLSKLNLEQGALIYFDDERQYISISPELSEDDQRNINLHLLIEFFKHYKLLKDGGKFVATLKLEKNNSINFYILKLEKPDTKIINFPKKY